MMFIAAFGRKRIDGPSPRELEILKLRAQGYNAKEIAEKLSRSISTVTCHDKSIVRKLNAKNMIHAMHLAHQQGYLH